MLLTLIVLVCSCARHLTGYDAERLIVNRRSRRWRRYRRTLRRVLPRIHYRRFMEVMRGLDARRISKQAAFTRIQPLFIAYPAIIPGFNKLRCCGPRYRAYTLYQLVLGRLLISSIYLDHAVALHMLFLMISFGCNTLYYPD